MRLALYARVSTREEQEPDTQLLPLRAEAERLGARVAREYVDRCSAADLRGRVAWRQLQDDCARKRIDMVLVFKLDRAFRSVKHMHDTLYGWSLAGVDFRSLREGFDTSTAAGRLMMTLLAAVAEFELETIRERVRAGMDRAAKRGTRSGRPIGRPRASVAVEKLYDAYRVHRSVRAAAKVVGCPPATAHDRLREAGLLELYPPVAKGGNGSKRATAPKKRVSQTKSFATRREG